jgi:hypothetical protein
LSCNKFVTDESFEPVLIQQRNETEALIARYQQAYLDRFGEPMSDENVWLRGRHEETAALDSILLAIDRVRQHDGSFTPIRGAGAPQRREEGQP